MASVLSYFFFFFPLKPFWEVKEPFQGETVKKYLPLKFLGVGAPLCFAFLHTLELLCAL